MKTIEKTIRECNVCGTLLKPETDSFIVGNSNILIVGESPAKNGWILTGKAFYDVKGNVLATGKILNKLLSELNLTIDDICFTECCKCHMPNRKDLLKCAQKCNHFLNYQIENCNCDFILPMGAVPTQILLNQKIDKLSNYVGKRFEVKFNNKTKTVIPIYHTSPISPLSYKGNIDIFKQIKKDYFLK